VRGLERDGLVVREPHEHDGRAVRVRATGKGRRILVRGRQRRVAEFAGLLEGSSAADLRTLGDAAAIVESLLAGAARPQ